MEGRRAKAANGARTWARRAAPNRLPLNTAEHRNAKGVTAAGFPRGTSSSCEKALIESPTRARASRGTRGAAPNLGVHAVDEQARPAKVGNAQYLTANTYRLRGSNTSSLPAPPARECWRRLEPTSKRTATTGMNFSCAPALVQHQTNGSHCDELFLRASAGVRTRHCTVRTRRARYLTANTYRLRGSSTSSRSGSEMF